MERKYIIYVYFNNIDKKSVEQEEESMGFPSKNEGDKLHRHLLMSRNCLKFREYYCLCVLQKQTSPW